MLMNTPVAVYGHRKGHVTSVTQHHLRLTYRINWPSLVGDCPRLGTCRSLHSFSMMQLHNLALLLVAFSKGVAAAVVNVPLPIVNKYVAPDGFLRV